MTVAATTTIGATVVYPSATTTGTATQPEMVGLSATTIDNRIAGGLFAVAMRRQGLFGEKLATVVEAFHSLAAGRHRVETRR